MLRVIATVLGIAAVYYLLPTAEAGACPAFFALIGPCVSGICPTNATCICGCCCMSVTPMTMTFNRGFGRRLGAGASRTGSGSGCQDRLPDCLEKRNLCSNPRFDDLMTEKCAKTCNRCPKKKRRKGRRKGKWITADEAIDGIEDNKENKEDADMDDDDPTTSIAEWYGNNQGGFTSYEHGGGYAAEFGSGYASGYGPSYASYYS